MRAIGVATFALALGCAHATPRPKPSIASSTHPPKGGAMAGCTRTVTPADAERLDEILDAQPEGAIICLEPGLYRTHLFLKHSVTLRGSGEVILDAASRITTVTIGKDGIRVSLEHLTLRRGFGGALGWGGNLQMTADADVRLSDCALLAGASDSNGGGGFLAHGGHLLLERCRIENNSGRQAAAAIVDGWAKVILRDSVVTGNQAGHRSCAILVQGAGDLTVDHSSIQQEGAPAMRLRSFAEQPPTVTFDGALVGEVVVEPGPAPKITATHTAFAHPLAGTEAGGNVVGSFTLDEAGHAAGTLGAGRGPR